MNFEEFTYRFESIMSEYTELHIQYTQQLRALLIEYNNNIIYKYNETKSVELSNAYIEELKDVFADIKCKHSIAQNANRQDIFREQQTSQNRYTSDNQYPPKG